MYLVLLIKRSKRDVKILNWNGNIISYELVYICEFRAKLFNWKLT